jgi:wyosine [tRNA(Phe)-imidazoG37] synthetase (radical SAM superfamily)
MQIQPKKKNLLKSKGRMICQKKEEQAKVILEALDEYIQIDWNMEDMYVKAIKEGLDNSKTRYIKKS